MTCLSLIPRSMHACDSALLRDAPARRVLLAQTAAGAIHIPAVSIDDARGAPQILAGPDACLLYLSAPQMQMWSCYLH
jgi:hypothetical protein